MAAGDVGSLSASVGKCSRRPVTQASECGREPATSVLPGTVPRFMACASLASLLASDRALVPLGSLALAGCSVPWCVNYLALVPLEVIVTRNTRQVCSERAKCLACSL